VQRVLILTPASLRLQWRDEMWDKFSLPFELVDRERTENLRRRLGMDANPWRSFPRVIASYHYLRQPDVLDEFEAACRTPEGSPHLPWDLLVLDEVGVQFGTETENLVLFRILNRRYEDMKPTILVSNVEIGKLTEFVGERVIDRLCEGGGGILEFTWESARQ